MSIQDGEVPHCHCGQRSYLTRCMQTGQSDCPRPHLLCVESTYDRYIRGFESNDQEIMDRGDLDLI